MVKRLVIALVFLFSLVACSEEKKPYEQIIEATLAPGHYLKKTQAVDIYGGTAAVSDGVAAWWVKDGTAYTVNGVAISLSPKAKYAPPSISYADVEDALKGKKYLLPDNFGITFWHASKRFEEILAEVKVKAVATSGNEDIIPPLSWDTSIVKGEVFPRASVTIKETGGMLTEVRVLSTVFLGKNAEKDQTNRDSLAFITAAIMLAVRTQENFQNAMKTLVNPFLQSKEEEMTQVFQETTFFLEKTFDKKTNQLHIGLSLTPASK